MHRFSRDLTKLLRRHHASEELKKELIEFLNNNFNVCMVQRSISEVALQVHNDTVCIKEYEKRTAALQLVEGLLANNLIGMETTHEDYAEVTKYTVITLKP